MGRNETDLIIRLQAQQQRFESQLKRSERSFSTFHKRVNKTAHEVQNAFGLAFGGFMLAQGVKSSVRTIANFEFQMQKVAAVSGASNEELKALAGNAKELGRQSKFTATQIGTLQEEFARLGFNTPQIVKMTDATRKLATVANSELGEAARVVGQMINAFNLDASESTRVANVMAESFSKSALDLEKFTTSMASVSAVARTAGYDIEETTAMIGKLVDNGIDASTAGTQLRNVFLTLTQKGISLTKALSEVRNAEDSNAKALELFEKRAVPVVTTLARMEEETSDLAAELGDANIELQTMADIMEDNLVTDAQKLTSAWEGFILALGKTGPLRKVNQLLAEYLNRWTDVFEGNPDRGYQARLSKLANDAYDALNAGIAPSGKGQSSQSSFYSKAYSNRGGMSGDAFNFLNAGKDGAQGRHDFSFVDTLKTYRQTLEAEANETIGAMEKVYGAFEIELGDFDTMLAAETAAMEDSLNMDYSETVAQGAENTANALDEYNKRLGEKLDETQVYFTTWKELAQHSIASGINIIASTFADTKNLKKGFGEIIGAMGDGLIGFGAALTAWGIGKKILASGGLGTGAIAGGAMVVAAGIAAKRWSNKIGGAGGGGGGGAVSASFGAGSGGPGTFLADGQSRQPGTGDPVTGDSGNPIIDVLNDGNKIDFKEVFDIESKLDLQDYVRQSKADFLNYISFNKSDVTYDGLFTLRKKDLQFTDFGNIQKQTFNLNKFLGLELLGGDITEGFQPIGLGLNRPIQLEITGSLSTQLDKVIVDIEKRKLDLKRFGKLPGLIG